MFYFKLEHCSCGHTFQRSVISKMLRKSSRISAWRCRQLSSQYLLAAKLAKILKYEESSHRSSTNNASFIVFQCDLCDAGYVSYTRGHLHTCVDGHKRKASSIYKHYHERHSEVPKDLLKRFSILKKCSNKFDCLVNEMLFIRDLKPTLNVQSASIRAKVFV